MGLHPADDYRLIGTLSSLRDMGNTVVVVEHDEAMMRAADFIADLGPGAGEHGGRVVVAGTLDEVMDAPDSLTGQYLSGRRKVAVPEQRRPGNGKSMAVRGGRENNLKGIDVEFPLGQLVCITGVSGSGKSTLIYDILYKRLAQILVSCQRPSRQARRGGSGWKISTRVVNIDQSPIGRTPRSNPATYTGAFTPIRELFSNLPDARVRGLQAGPVLLQCQGRTLRSLPGRGLQPDRDAVPP